MTEDVAELINRYKAAAAQYARSFDTHRASLFIYASITVQEYEKEVEAIAIIREIFRGSTSEALELARDWVQRFGYRVQLLMDMIRDGRLARAGDRLIEVDLDLLNQRLRRINPETIRLLLSREQVLPLCDDADAPVEIPLSQVPQIVGWEYRQSTDGSSLIGNTNCINNAKSPHLRCAINPCGPCEGCKDFEEK